MSKYGKLFSVVWSIWILLILIIIVPLGDAGTRIYKIDVPASYATTPVREQDALAKDFLEERITEIGDTKTFVDLEPEFSYLNLKKESKSVEIQYLGRAKEGVPSVIHTVKNIGWARSYKIVGNPKIEGTSLVLETERDWSNFVWDMVFIGGLFGALIGVVVCAYVWMVTS